MTLETLLTILLVLWALAAIAGSALFFWVARSIRKRSVSVVNTIGATSSVSPAQIADGFRRAGTRQAAQHAAASTRKSQPTPGRTPPSPGPAPSPSSGFDPVLAGVAGYMLGSSMHGNSSPAPGPESCRAPAFSSGAGGDYGGGGASGSWDSGSSSSSSLDSSSSSSSDSSSSSSCSSSD